MPTSLTTSTRADVLALLPPGAAGADPTDDDLIRGLCATAATLRALVGTSAVTHVDLGPALRALDGERVDAAGLDPQVRRVVEGATALHRQLAEARKAPPDAGAADRLARAVRAAADDGRVADDLPPGARAVVQAVADLRADLEQARAAVAEAEARATVAGSSKDAKARERASVREREEWAKQRASYEREIKQLGKDLAAAQHASATVKTEAQHRAGEVATLEAEVRQGRAVVELAAEIVGLPRDADPAAVLSRLADRFGAPTPPAQAQAAAASAAPEPPHVREVAWRDLQPGELALDRAAYRALRETGSDLEPHDPRRRVLFLRAGDHVVHLRTDGLHEDGVTTADAPTYRPGRGLRDARSLRALVIAEDVQPDQHAVRDAFRAWLTTADAAGCLAAQIDEAPGPEAEDGRVDVLPTSPGAAATVAATPSPLEILPPKRRRTPPTSGL